MRLTHYQMQLRPLNKPILISFIVVSLLGFFDAVYLTIEHYLGRIPPCTVVSGCESVLTSSYATILGIPVALIGTIFYFTVFTLAMLYLDTKKDILIKLGILLSFCGLCASIGFVYLQLFVIKAICLYCMGSAITSTLLFVFSAYILKKYRISESSTQTPISSEGLN